jgi:GNAT superfamily N-acetyltransferase
MSADHKIIRIDESTKHLIPLCNEIEQLVFDETTTINLETNKDDVNVFAAIANDTVLGILYWTVDDTHPTPFYLHTLAVNPIYRSTGIGKSLMNHFIKYLHNLGIKRCWAKIDMKFNSLNQSPQRLILFYAEFGFIPVHNPNTYTKNTRNSTVIAIV